jgi:hypothetical protein
MPTREEALRFMEDSRRTVPPPTDAERVEKLRRQNLRLKFLPLDLTDDELLAILRKVDQLPADSRTPVIP